MLAGDGGVDVARRLRDRGFTTPIVGISASRLALEVAAGSGLFDATVCKPFDVQELTDCVQRAVAASELKAPEDGRRGGAAR
jgi:CheY-like chemotaxis protein